jgi:hypothetical protein
LPADCSRGVLPFAASHESSFVTGNSCSVLGPSTMIVNRVAGPISARASEQFLC